MLERLRAASPLQERTVQWGVMRLRQRFHVLGETPPLERTTSSRAIVFRDREVLVVHDADGHKHVWPGGRCEAGETLEETVRRELFEETGWSVTGLRPFAVLHYTHLTARPENYPHPYPDFLQAIYLAQAVSYDASKIVRDDGWEKDAGFVDIDEALIVIDEDQKEILRAALRAGPG